MSKHFSRQELSKWFNIPEDAIYIPTPEDMAEGYARVLEVQAESEQQALLIAVEESSEMIPERWEALARMIGWAR